MNLEASGINYLGYGKNHFGGVIIMNDVSNKYWKCVPLVVRGWYREFIKSDNFKSLSEEQKMLAQNVIMAFTEGAYQFEGESPQYWDEHGIRCCFDFLGIKSNYNQMFMRSVPAVLVQFFGFLFEKGYKEDGKIFAEIIKEMEFKSSISSIENKRMLTRRINH